MRPIKRIVFTLILYCLASAQSEAVQKNYVFTTYSQEDGLSSGTIKKIVQDSAGYFWFLSENGLSRFDGYSFKIYSHDPNNSLSIPSSNLLNMWVDEEKHIYLATEKALLLFHPSSNSFETIFSTRNQKDILNYLPYKGGFLFVKDNQLGFFNKKNQKIFTYNLPSNLSLGRKKGIRIQNDNIWFSCEDGILCYFEAEKKISKIPIQQSNTVDAPLDFSSLHLFVNNKSEMCFYSNATLYKFNASKKIFQPYLNLKLKESSFNPIKSIQQYDTCSILLRFQYNRIGILNFNTGNLKYIYLNPYPKVSNDSIRIFSIYPSTPTTMWVSTTNSR